MVYAFLFESAGSRRRRRTNTAPRARAGSVEPDAASAELWAPGLGFARRNAFEGDQSPQKQSKTDAPSLTGRTEAVKWLWLRRLCASVLVRH